MVPSFGLTGPFAHDRFRLRIPTSHRRESFNPPRGPDVFDRPEDFFGFPAVHVPRSSEVDGRGLRSLIQETDDRGFHGAMAAFQVADFIGEPVESVVGLVADFHPAAHVDFTHVVHVGSGSSDFALSQGWVASF